MSESTAQKGSIAEQDSALPAHSPDKWWSSKRAQRCFTIALFLALISSFIWWVFFAPYIRTDDARVAATVVAFAPKGMGGQIVAFTVDDGDRVKRGQPLFELDRRQVYAQLKRAKAQKRWMNRELERVQQQTKRGFASQRDLDRAVCDANLARADYQLARIAVEDRIVKSTLDGTVVLKSAEIGDFLQPGQTALIVADLDRAWISANIEETYARCLQSGQNVLVTIDEGGELKGRVKEILNATTAQFALIPADSGSGNYTKVVQRIPIKVALDLDPQHPLRIGQSAKIRISTEKWT